MWFADSGSDFLSDGQDVAHVDGRFYPRPTTFEITEFSVGTRVERLFGPSTKELVERPSTARVYSYVSEQMEYRGAAGDRRVEDPMSEIQMNEQPKTRKRLTIGKQIYHRRKALGNRTPHANEER